LPRIHFQQQLVALKDKLLAMAALSQQALEFSVEAYLNHDRSLSAHVKEIEEAINTAERDVDEMAYDLLAKEQPMAIDLRFILSVIKINGDLERIGDQSTNIASRAVTEDVNALVQLPVEIEEMGARVGVMIRTAIHALLEGDTDLAESVITMDDEVDEMNRQIQTELVGVMEKQPDLAVQSLNAIIVSRNLERAADHATNIAEDVIFWVRGSDVRHKFSMTHSVEDRNLPIN
jgi:phosphate transport system protein